MGQRIGLRFRIYMILLALVFITLAGGLVMVWYTYRMEALTAAITEKDLTAFQTAESLEMALVNQKGFVSYYFLDGDPDWLRKLGEYRQIFKERLQQAQALVENDPQKHFIDLIEKEYNRYIEMKDKVIAHYEAGEREAGAALHPEVRQSFFSILDLCEQFKDLYSQSILVAKQKSSEQAQKLRLIAVSAMLVGCLLVLILAFVLINHILEPVRRLTLEADRQAGAPVRENEIKALSRSVRGLIDDVEQTHSELEKSRENLMQAEKMALVGKLAAGMAHSIRNPFTSVKMRLFSLGRTLELSDTQKDDLSVISEEIRHIDTIIQNFLEFSRPPKLKMQSISPSVVVDLALQLLEHRLKSYDVNIKLIRNQALPEIQADPEQLKEVLVNIIVNACEAMPGGGSIVIHEEECHTEQGGSAAVIRLTDNGPGIAESILEKVLQPFFTTKENGTGLGLSIAARIVEEHQGRLEVASKEGQETSFIISLPVKETESEYRLDR